MSAAVFAIAASALVLYACGGGDDDDQGGAGSGPTVTPTLGSPCTKDCTNGLVCAFQGTFARQCTAGCNSQGACELLAPGIAVTCFGSAEPQCGLLCTTDAECPTGTHCAQVEGQMGCVLAAQ